MCERNNTAHAALRHMTRPQRTAHPVTTRLRVAIAFASPSPSRVFPLRRIIARRILSGFARARRNHGDVTADAIFGHGPERSPQHSPQNIHARGATA
jgi:hypothetical protein